MTDTPPPSAPQGPPPGQPQYQAPQAQPAAPLTPAEDVARAALAYQLAWLGWAAFVGPLIIWLMFKDRGPRVKNEGKEALNFGITVSAIVIIWNAIFGSIASANTPFSYFGFETGNAALFWIFGLLNWIVILGVVVIALIWSLRAASVVKAGGAFRYPFAVRLIK